MTVNFLLCLFKSIFGSNFVSLWMFEIYGLLVIVIHPRFCLAYLCLKISANWLDLERRSFGCISKLPSINFYFYPLPVLVGAYTPFAYLKLLSVEELLSSLPANKGQRCSA